VWSRSGTARGPTSCAACRFATRTASGSLPPGSLHDLLTIFLDPSHGKGGILLVVNDSGGSSTIANPDVPVRW